MRYRGAWSHGKASVIWREIHSAVGFSVTPNDSQIRRPCLDPERDRWKDKKVDRRDAVGMVVQKRAPALRWRPRVAGHIPSDCRLSDLEAELEQFTMNVWGAPERVRPAHLANERAQLNRDLWFASMGARSL